MEKLEIQKSAVAVPVHADAGKITCMLKFIYVKTSSNVWGLSQQGAL